MHQALPEPPSLRLPPIHGPPPRQQPGPLHQLPQSLPPPPRHQALPPPPPHPPLPQRLPPIPPIPPRQPLPQSDSVGQSHQIPHFLPPPPHIGRHRRIFQWLGVSPQKNPIVLISTNKTHLSILSIQSTLIEKSILILMTCTIQTLSRVTSMTLLHHQMKVYSPLIHIPLPLSPSNPFILHPLQDWMLPELPRFLLWVAWNIMDLCNLIYQCLLCQVLILMILMTLQVSPLLHTHLHLHLFRMCPMGGHV